MNKIAIVFSEGGMRSAYSVGVALALVDKYKLTDPDIVIGASGSSAIAAYYVSKQFKSGQNIWENLLSTKKFISFWRLEKIIDIDYLIDEVVKKQEPLNIQAIRESKTKLLMAATDLTKGDTQYFSNQDNIFEALRASNAIAFFGGKRVLIHGDKFVDGGFTAALADDIAKARELGATKIIVVNNVNESLTLKILLVIYKFLFHRNLKKINLSSKFVPDDSIFLIMPTKKLAVTSTLDNNQAHLKETIKIGYDDVVNNKALESFLANE